MKWESIIASPEKCARIGAAFCGLMDNTETHSHASLALSEGIYHQLFVDSSLPPREAFVWQDTCCFAGSHASTITLLEVRQP